jgi:hypothetical protein
MYLTKVMNVTMSLVTVRSVSGFLHPRDAGLKMSAFVETLLAPVRNAATVQVVRCVLSVPVARFALSDLRVKYVELIQMDSSAVPRLAGARAVKLLVEVSLVLLFQVRELAET